MEERSSNSYSSNTLSNTNTEENSRYFHFHLGPIQEFIGQARRTRDYWASSFLLSWLTANAIQACEDQGAKIIFPAKISGFFSAMLENTGKGPQQGGVPARFMAEISPDIANSFNPHAVKSAVAEAWKKLCNKIIQEDSKLLEIKLDNPIWKRQTENFWDIIWIITPTLDTDAINKRKQWRTCYQTDEPGFKCMQLTGYQELSGSTSIASRNEFWKSAKKKCNNGLDFSEKEALCAIAYIKRRFVHVFSELTYTIETSNKETPNKTLRGWTLPHNVPSTAYLSAAFWLQRLGLQLKAEQEGSLNTKQHIILKSVKNLLTEIHTHTDVYKFSEINNPLKQLSDLANAFTSAVGEHHAVYQRLIALDGAAFFPENYDKAPEALTALYNASNSKPCQYYAILIMDADKLSVLMNNISLQPLISEGLINFINSVPTIVEDHNGFTIYAGGEDVLALFPVHNVFDAALALKNAYLEIFDKINEDHSENIETTISAAINICHYANPLTDMIKQSHYLLDDVAKTQTERNAIAIGIHKPSRHVITWHQKWDVYCIKGEKESSQHIFNRFLFSGSVVSSLFSNSFLFKQRTLLRTLNRLLQANKISPKDTELLILKELRKTATTTQDSPYELDEELVALFIRSSRKHGDDQAIHADFGLLLKYLSQIIEVKT